MRRNHLIIWNDGTDFIFPWFRLVFAKAQPNGIGNVWKGKPTNIERERGEEMQCLSNNSIQFLSLRHYWQLSSFFFSSLVNYFQKYVYSTMARQSFSLTLDVFHCFFPISLSEFLIIRTCFWSYYSVWFGEKGHSENE